MHTTSPRDRRHELVLSEPGNHRTLEAILPTGFVHQISNLYKSDLSFLMRLNEKDLKRELRARGFEPGKRDYVLRVQFWNEYDSCQATPRGEVVAMNVSRVIKRAIPKEVFYKHYISDPLRLAWLISPPQEYVEAVEALARRAIDKLEEFLDLVKLEKNGFIDMTAVKQVAAVFQSAHHKAQLMRGGPLDSNEGKKRRANKVEEVPADAPPPAETVAEKMARLKAEREALLKEKRASGIGVDKPPEVE
jgi:hypothetical protein